ncbi:MAG: serine/threonine protein kinase [Candidatus Altiarchaeales archaeon ex4484_2]|nr:MAG: serine/threonine protein kinase [Candidatus Altiarchaeales archaeon ex4484_2]
MVKKSEYELRKIYAGVFDKSTLLSLERLMRGGYLEELESMISTGKEANVYHGCMGEKEIAVKIYAIDASSFKNMEKYILGDRRFKTWRNRRQLVYTWAQKEYKNLARVHGFIECPRPHQAYRNILVMDFIGRDNIPAPRLKDSPPKNPKEYFNKIVGYIRGMYERGLVHADLSEYNVLNTGEKPVIIDLSTGVLLDHPLADKFLKRDIYNICRYFRSEGVDCDEKEVLAEVKKISRGNF